MELEIIKNCHFTVSAESNCRDDSYLFFDGYRNSFYLKQRIFEVDDDGEKIEDEDGHNIVIDIQEFSLDESDYWYDKDFVKEIIKFKQKVNKIMTKIENSYETISIKDL